MACDFLQEDLMDVMDRVTFSEKRDIVRAKRNQWQIKKGEKYTNQFLVDGSYCWSFKGITAIHEICLEYELYPEL
jgi:hypothetical protein